MTNKPLLIAIDLDGTLLTEEKEISPRTKKALQEAVRQGHKVVISTGRPFRSSKRYYQELQLNTPIVNFNGALVHHPLDHHWGVFHHPLDLKVAQQVIEMSNQFGVQNIMMEVLDEVYLKEHDEVIINSFFDPQTSINSFPENLDMQPTTLLIHPYEYDSEALRNCLAEAHAEVINHRQWKAPWHVIEIVKAGLNKAEGLKMVASTYGIGAENIIAFGDEDNDMEMIEFAGIGVAMGNAIPKLKEIANEITLTNEQEGIALFLEKHIL